jgi:5-formyltetrahydrofolate cyclo-ligase
LLAWRGSIDPAIHRQWSVSVCNGMTAILAERPKATVGFYWPIQNEIGRDQRSRAYPCHDRATGRI